MRETLGRSKLVEGRGRLQKSGWRLSGGRLGRDAAGGARLDCEGIFNNHIVDTCLLQQRE